MTSFDAFRYDGRRALVVGGATGMGAAAAELLQSAGADVVVMDFAEVSLPVATAIRVNLAEKESIDAALDACEGPVHALLSCAGVADGTPGIEKINFIGHRHIIDRLLADGLMPKGSAIGFISSAAGLGWEANLDRIKTYLATPDFDSAVEWIAANGGADYMSTKQAMCAYVAIQAFPLMQRGIRINAICPGPTDTPLAQANKELWLGFGSDYRDELGVPASTPLEQGTRSCSYAVPRPRPSAGSPWSPTWGTSPPGSPRRSRRRRRPPTSSWVASDSEASGEQFGRPAPPRRKGPNHPVLGEEGDSPA
ncbi:MAG: SDR family NAD(P)-dependent oxidoreductase [Acidimicrobiales bacterium]